MEVNAEVKKQKYQISVSYRFPYINLLRGKDSSNKNDILAFIKFGGGAFFLQKCIQIWISLKNVALYWYKLRLESLRSWH